MNDGRTYDDQGLPWLEPVEDEDDAPAVSGRRMFVALLLVVAAAAVIAVTMFLMGRGEAGPAGLPELIRAEAGPYKVRPDDPGGLDVAGESETAFATGAGEDTDAALDPAKLPPDAPTVAPIAPVADAKPPVAVKPPAETPPEATPASGGPTIQLGAYGSTIKAETAWGMLAGRFPQVAAMSKQVVTATVAGKTVVRLRASGSSAQAAAACAALKSAGESCLVVK
jgi:hypothetical protein